MQRSLQVQILSWLAALSILGAAIRPSFDTILFATAFVVGTLMMHVHERLQHPEVRRTRALGHAVGRVLGASVAWLAVALLHWSMVRLPARLTAPMLIAAAVVPTGIVLIEGVSALLARREKVRAREEV